MKLESGDVVRVETFSPGETGYFAEVVSLHGTHVEIFNPATGENAMVPSVVVFPATEAESDAYIERCADGEFLPGK